MCLVPSLAVAYESDTWKRVLVSFFFSFSSTTHLVETGLGVEFAERGDDQWLGRALRLEVRAVGRNGLWVWQWAHL